MDLEIPFLRGNTQENNAYAAPAGVITIDTEKKELRIHDGLTFGGHVLPNIGRLDLLQESINGLEIPAITGLADQLDLKLAVSLLGVGNGVATLDDSGKVHTHQLPSFVDDIVEVASIGQLPAEGESGKLYVVLDSDLVYRWTGVQYQLISAMIEDTDHLAEGVVNLYYTPARVRNTIVVAGDISYEMETGVLDIQTPVKLVNGIQGDLSGNVQLGKSNIGLDLLMNYQFADEATAAAGESSTAYLSPLGNRQALSMINVKREGTQWLLESGTLAEYVTTEDGAILTTEDGVDLDFEF